MVDNRSHALSPKDLDRKPTWRQLPAVKAGQLTPWSMEERFGYAGFAPVLERLAAAVEKSKKLDAQPTPGPATGRSGRRGVGGGWGWSSG